MQKLSRAAVFEFEAFGTAWSIETVRLLSDAMIRDIQNRVEEFDKAYSRFRLDSLVSMAARKKGEYVLPDGADYLFGFYEKLYRLTDGKVTPLIGGMLEKAGYDAEYSFRNQPQRALPDLHDALERRGNIVEVKIPVTIDVGAAGKGYFVDVVCEILEAAGIDEYVVDASGDLRHKGVIENKVGLEDPRDPTKVIGMVDILNKSLCASASNRRRWGNDMHHVFDPDSKTPVQDIIATWVIADTAMVADGIATSLFFADPWVLREEFEYEYARMHANGAIDYSPAVEGKLF